MNTPGKNKLSVAVLGPGAIGGFLIILLKINNYQVKVIAKKSTAKKISEKGIKIDSKTFGNISVKPEVITKLNFEPDILFITVKSTHLSDALKKIDKKFLKNTIIVPLLNGIEHMSILRSIFGKNVIAAIIGNVEVKRIDENNIIHTTKSATVELASDKDFPKEKINQLCNLISDIGIECKLHSKESDVFWGKLVRLNAIACTTSATNKPIGYIRSDNKWRKILINCLREGAAVAFAEGVKIDPEVELTKIDSFSENLTTSMQRDIAAGRKSELDAIAGAIVRIGKKHGIKCPIITDLIDTINLKSIKY